MVRRICVEQLFLYDCNKTMSKEPRTLMGYHHSNKLPVFSHRTLVYTYLSLLIRYVLLLSQLSLFTMLFSQFLTVHYVLLKAHNTLNFFRIIYLGYSHNFHLCCLYCFWLLCIQIQGVALLSTLQRLLSRTTHREGILFAHYDPFAYSRLLNSFPISQ